MTTYSLNKPNYFLFPDYASEVAVHALNTSLAASNDIYKRNTAQFGLLVFKNKVNNTCNSQDDCKLTSFCLCLGSVYTRCGP